MRKHTWFERFSKCANQSWFGIMFLILRVALGAVFLYAGVTKFGDWSAAGYLAGATGPLASWFQSMAGNAFIDSLNAWGLTLVGVCLILGIFVRPASFFGALIMLLYYLANFYENTAHGLIDNHVILILVLLMFISGGVGHVLGLDGLIHDNLRSRRWWSDWLFR